MAIYGLGFPLPLGTKLLNLHVNTTHMNTLAQHCKLIDLCWQDTCMYSSLSMINAADCAIRLLTWHYFSLWVSQNFQIQNDFMPIHCS